MDETQARTTLPERVGAKQRRGFEPPRGISRVLQVLRAMADAGRPVSLAELAVQLGLPRTSLFAILKGMEHEGYLVFDAETYQLGPEAFKLGHTIAQSASFPNAALPILQGLARASEETVILSAISEDRRHVVYVSVIEAASPLRFSVKPGTHRPLSASASGQAVLAHLPTAECDAYLASGPFQRFTPGTVTTTSALRDAVALVKRRHWSMTVDGTVLGAVGIAAPWFDASGAVGGAINIAAPTARVLHRQERCARAVLEAAEAVSRVLGYTGPYPP